VGGKVEKANSAIPHFFSYSLPDFQRQTALPEGGEAAVQIRLLNCNTVTTGYDDNSNLITQRLSAEAD